jgi:hypothetical protein
MPIPPNDPPKNLLEQHVLDMQRTLVKILMLLDQSQDATLRSGSQVILRDIAAQQKRDQARDL